MAKKAKKSNKKQVKRTPSKKITKPTQPTKPTEQPPTPTVKHETATTSALTITHPRRRTFHPNEAVFSIVRTRPRPNELPELSVRLCGKELAQVPLPENGELREEVDVILRMLIRRMAELMGDCKTAADAPSAATRIKPALDLLRLVGMAYL